MRRQWNAIFLNFLVNGDVKLEPFGHSYCSVSFMQFAYQMWKPQFLSFVQSLFDNLPLAILSDNVF